MLLLRGLCLACSGSLWLPLLLLAVERAGRNVPVVHPALNVSLLLLLFRICLGFLRRLGLRFPTEGIAAAIPVVLRLLLNCALLSVVVRVVPGPSS